MSATLVGEQPINEQFEKLNPPDAEALARAESQARQILDHQGDLLRLRGVGRDVAVAVFREIAARLKRGDIDGARFQWLDTHGGHQAADGAVVSGMEYVVREPNRVRLQQAEVMEDAFNAPEPTAPRLRVVKAEV